MIDLTGRARSGIRRRHFSWQRGFAAPLMKPMVKNCLVSLVWTVPVAGAAADPGLREMLTEASSCSDVSLKDAASLNCESPDKIAAQAVAKCQAKWDAVAQKALGAGSNDTSPQERTKSLRRYSEAMEYEYIRIAELKAIDMRTAAGRCGFD